MSGWLLVNPRSGGGSQLDTVTRAAATLGIETRLLRPGEDGFALALEAQADVLGVAGGDGSLAAVASAALERDLPFVCVPAGTRNHFARDVGLDRGDPAAALAAFTGIERMVDVGRASDRLFLNNVSFGAYAVLLHRGWRRALDALRVRYRLTVDGEPVRTRVLLVSNNAYSLTGKRGRLDEGLLHVYTTGGELKQVPRVVVESRGRALPVAIDGESVVLPTPVECRIEPLALRLLLPGGPGA